MNRKYRGFYIGLAILFTFSFSLLIFSLVYENTLPKLIEEINNSAIGAILTAVITVLLLVQQSSSEELKERNVRVFEEKSEHFKNFIDQLWMVWEDRVITLEELNALIKSVSKDIVFYTKPETVGKILDSLNQLAEETMGVEMPDFSDEDKSLRIQTHIFNIINELAKDINLGGELSGNNILKLNQLERKIIPVLAVKQFRKQYIEAITSYFKKYEHKDGLIQFSEVLFDETNLKFHLRINNSPVYYHIGPFLREKHTPIIFGFYVEYYKHREFEKYREESEGYWKNFLGGKNRNEWVFIKGESAIEQQFVDFNEAEKIIANSYSFSKEGGDVMTQHAIAWLENWQFKNTGKTLIQVIDECTILKNSNLVDKQ